MAPKKTLQVQTGDAGTYLTVLPLSDVLERPGENPNHMSEEHYKLLVHNVRQGKFLQPILVREVGGVFEIIDGHHRARAAREAGRLGIPALVTDANDEESMAHVLALNHLKGELDLSQASKYLQELVEAGFSDLLLTGFSGAEIQTLVKQTPDITDALENLGAGEYDPGDEPEAAPQTTKRFAMRLIFDSEAQRDAVKAACLALGSTVESGLLAALGV